MEFWSLRIFLFKRIEFFNIVFWELGLFIFGFVFNLYVDGIIGGGWIFKVYVSDFILKYIFVFRDKRYFYFEVVFYKYCISYRYNIFIFFRDDGFVDFF